MHFQLTDAVVRPWQAGDTQSLATHANNRQIWRNLRDAFPHPYSLEDAHAFHARVDTTRCNHAGQFGRQGLVEAGTPAAREPVQRGQPGSHRAQQAGPATSHWQTYGLAFFPHRSAISIM